MFVKNKMLGLLSALLILTIFYGCGSLIVGTFVISLDIKGGDIVTSADLSKFYVDLTKESEWNDHKDEIKYIDNVGFQLWVTNNGDDAVTGQLFASTDSSFADTTEVRDSAILILDGLILPPGVQTYVDWPSSLTYLREVDKIKKLVEGGKFAVYALTTTLPFDITVDSATVIVTVTAGS